MMKKFLLLFLLVSSFSFAQNPDALFADANKLYKDGKYEEAINLYEKIVAQKVISSELYYNLGNSYYKLNKVAPAIYYLESALLINPLNEDAKNNLVFAKRLTLDRIEALPKSIFQKFDENYLQKLTYNQWAWVCIVLSCLGSFCFLLFYFTFSSGKKRMYFIFSIVCFFLLFASIGITYQQYNNYINSSEAIVFEEEVTLKNAPTFNSDDVFTLHEGTKVKVLDAVDNWSKIKIADGKIGWLPSENIKLFDKF